MILFQSVVEILRKHQSLPTGVYYDNEFKKFGSLRFEGRDPSTWDFWVPCKFSGDWRWISANDSSG